MMPSALLKILKTVNRLTMRKSLRNLRVDLGINNPLGQDKELINLIRKRNLLSASRLLKELSKLPGNILKVPFLRNRIDLKLRDEIGQLKP